MLSIPPSVLTIFEIVVIDTIAIELQSTELTAARRSELAEAIDKIAKQYAWDFRLGD